MTTTRRIISGSAAAWTRIVITLFGQIALIPIYLSYWSLEQYGCWLVIQSISGLTTVLSFGHQSFVGHELLKCGSNDRKKLALIFYSSLPYAIIIGLFELCIVLGLVYFGASNIILDQNSSLSIDLLTEANAALVIQSIVWLLVSSIGGLGGRLLSPLGYYPRNAWWGVLGSVLTMFVSVTSVVMGAGLIILVYAISFVTILLNLFLYFDFWKIFIANNMYPVKPDWILGFKNSFGSIGIALITFLDLMQQQGLRIFISALVGIKEMAAFSTMRTASNVGRQGIGTITVPILPELMRFLGVKDQQRTDSTLAFMWFFVVILMAPMLLSLQFIMPDIFTIWTRGKITYDPIVFGLFSISLIIYGVGQPAIAILQGNNLIKEQIFTTALTTFLVIVGILLLAPTFGIRSAALILATVEFINLYFLVKFTKKWLIKNNMHWPAKIFKITFTSAVINSIGVFVVSTGLLSGIYAFLSIIFLNIFLVKIYFKEIPALAFYKLNNYYMNSKVLFVNYRKYIISFYKNKF